MCLFASAPCYKLNKGFSLGFPFKPLGGLCPPRGLNKKASEKYPLKITYCAEYEDHPPKNERGDTNMSCKTDYKEKSQFDEAFSFFEIFKIE